MNYAIDLPKRALKEELRCLKMADNPNNEKDSTIVEMLIVRGEFASKRIHHLQEALNKLKT